ncbi:GGDEF domain-containing protein [Deinococcus petrolearius]|uniref:GGDEF domain-containing protein n=1 Tax=Deinococcus petrolearius TaxID=1751295 RepID=A0ABW1DKX4_9DEIO
MAAATALWWQQPSPDPLDRVALPLLALLWVVLWTALRQRALRLAQAQVAVFVGHGLYLLLALDHQFRVFAPQVHMLSESTYWFAPLYAAAFLFFLPRQALRLGLPVFLSSVGIVAGHFASTPALREDTSLVASTAQFLLVGATMMLLQAVMSQRHAAMLAAQVAATQDALTGLANRRAAEEHLLALQASGRAYALVLFDLDHFKRINDEHGHAVGDQVLRACAAHALRTLPTGALAARWGGEEFLLVLPEPLLGDCPRLIETLRASLTAQPVGPVGPVTASFGVAHGRPGESSTALLDRADAALYRAKAAGRDTVCFAV